MGHHLPDFPLPAGTLGKSNMIIGGEDGSHSLVTTNGHKQNGRNRTTSSSTIVTNSGLNYIPAQQPRTIPSDIIYQIEQRQQVPILHQPFRSHTALRETIPPRTIFEHQTSHSQQDLELARARLKRASTELGPNDMPATMTALYTPGHAFDLGGDFWGFDTQDPPGTPNFDASISPVISHGERLLSFRTHQLSGITLLDTFGQTIDVNLAAQLHGMFFLAESPWDAAGNPEGGVTGQPNELTCYRRNLFQISGSVTIPSISAVIIGQNTSSSTELKLEPNGVPEGNRRMIQALEATISGIESVELNSVKIIMVPWKSAASATQNSNDEVPSNPLTRTAEKEPAPIYLNYTANLGNLVDEDNEPSVYQLNWKRLQFRSATANNGRRKDLQQHFLVKISIIATLFPENGATGAGEKVSIAEAYSGAIIVRGRSPRNFSSRNDIPISGSVASSSRQPPTSNATTPPIPSAPKKARHHSTGSISSFDQVLERKPSLQQLQDNVYTLQPSHHIDILQAPLDASLLLNPGLVYSPSLWPNNQNWLELHDQLGPLPPQQYPAPAPSFLTQDFAFNSGQFAKTSDMSPQISVTGIDFLDSPPPEQPNTKHIRSNLTKATSGTSPAMDLLYEYFPIGVDDWLPPVDVVYRPHAAHHMTTVTTTGPARSKRLFSETPFE